MTWEQAKIGIPEEVTGKLAVIGRFAENRVGDAFESIGDSIQTPIVFVLHGCSGIDVEEQNFLYLLTLNGFVVIMPDSFAQPSRRSLCNPKSHRASVDEGVYAIRKKELEFAMKKIADRGWLQHDRTIYLVGFSEGAAIAALYTQYAFDGLVIVGWHCQGNGLLHGLNVADDVPVLAMIMRRDPWYPDSADRHCGELFGARSHSKSVTLDGGGHAVFSAADVDIANQARGELLDFFARNHAPKL